MSRALRVNPIVCDGHGLCAELIPELIKLDEWGYPIVSPAPVPRRLAKHAKRAIAACPVLALQLAPAARLSGASSPGEEGDAGQPL
ncbi:MAG TPA: ferredoxin [Gaiellaceae bacterium]